MKGALPPSTSQARALKFTRLQHSPLFEAERTNQPSFLKLQIGTASLDMGGARDCLGKLQTTPKSSLVIGLTSAHHPPLANSSGLSCLCWCWLVSLAWWSSLQVLKHAERSNKMQALGNKDVWIISLDSHLIPRHTHVEVSNKGKRVST